MAYLGPVRRWDLFWADLEPHVGSEQAGDRRPVLVVSNDEFNGRFEIVTVLPITKLEGKRREAYPFEVVLKGDPIGNGLTSIVMPYQVRTISKKRLLAPIGSVHDVLCRGYIEDCLMAHLGIEWDEDQEE